MKLKIKKKPEEMMPKIKKKAQRNDAENLKNLLSTFNHLQILIFVTDSYDDSNGTQADL